MATKLQLELFKKNQKCVEIATIMANTIYPRIVDLLNKLGMEEVRLEDFEDFRPCCFTRDYKIQFFTLEEDLQSVKKKDIYEIKCKGKSICPYFDKELKDTEEFRSPSEEYLNFCKRVINALFSLENKMSEIDNVLQLARSISTPLTRVVLTEKHKKLRCPKK